MINENTIPDQCIILALDQYFTNHRDMDTWNDIKDIDPMEFDLPNEEDSLSEQFEDCNPAWISDCVLQLAKEIMNFTINHGGSFKNNEVNP